MVASGLELLQPLVAARLLEEIDCGGHVQSRAVPVQVASVRSRADLRAFIELPYRLHANGTPWVPQLRLERRLFLRPALQRLLQARRGGAVPGPARTVAWSGRISAQLDRSFNDYQQNAWGMFGFLELENDPEVDGGAARGGVRLAARARPRQQVGPMDFTMLDECGVLIEGYERPPMVRQPWQPPYYRELLEGAGLEKAVDLFMWELHISGREKVLPGDLGARRQARARARHPPAPDAAADPAARPRRVRRDLQRGVVAQLGLRALLEGGSRRLRPGAASGVRPRLVHGRRDRRRRGRGRGDHDSGHQPGAEADERQAPPARLVALPRGAGASSTAAGSDSSA